VRTKGYNPNNSYRT